MRLTVSVVHALSHGHQVIDMPVQNRRKWVRCPTKLEVEFVPVSSTLPVCSATIRDLSRGGIRLASIAPLESGMTIRIGLKTVREARVIHVSRETTGRWSAGCAFSEEITSADLQQLLESYS